MGELEARAAKELQMLEINNQAKQMPKTNKIDSDFVLKATETLRKYKAGKARLEKKIVANEEFWKLRQWRDKNSDIDFTPATAWLWSCIQSRYSDAMDSYPTCNFLARQQDDVGEAKKLSSIIPVVLEQNRYEETYSDLVWYALKHGGFVQGIFWNGNKNNGLGDVEIRRIDYLSLFWEAGITDIQDSEYLFNTELVSNRILEQRYPQCQGKLNGKSIEITKYLYDDTVPTEGKSVVIDMYYKTEINGRKAVHYVKYVNDIVLYATENDTEVPTTEELDVETGIPMVIPTGEPMSVTGLYNHGLYPFVCQQLYPIEGSICGYGLTDIGRDAQLQIDLINKAITDNAIDGASPRFFTKHDGSINEDEFRNPHNKFIHVAGGIGEENIRAVEHKPLDTIYVNVLQQKIDELKYVTSNQDVANGANPSGVTAASSIAALQEAAGKNARSSNKTFYRAYREMCYQVVELIRQFYDVPRTFRIVPDAMGEQFVEYSNAGIKPQEQMNVTGQMGYRLPEFDIEITAEKANPYKKMERNELALNFYQQGFFNPQMADQALSCLDMMDFEHKDEIVNKIRENGTLQQMLLQYQQIALQLAQQVDPALAEQMGNQILGMAGQPLPQGNGEVELDKTDENPIVDKARDKARASTEAE